MAVGGDLSARAPQLLLLLRGRISPAAADRCMRAAAERAGKTLEIRRDGRLTGYVHGDETTWAAWLAEDTLLLGERSYLEAALAGGASVVDDAPLMALVAASNPSGAPETGWAAGLLSASAAGELATSLGAAAPPAGFHGSLYTSHGFDLSAALRFADAPAAQAARDTLQRQLDMYKTMLPPEYAGYLQTVGFKAVDRDTVFTMRFTDAQVLELLGKLRALTGGESTIPGKL